MNILNISKFFSRPINPAFITSFRTFSTCNSRPLVTLKIHDDVAVVKFDNPNEKINCLSEKVSQETEKIINEIASSHVSSAVLISGKTENFIVGADIQMIEQCRNANEAEKLSRDGQLLLQRLSDSRKPVVAAIMGHCLGGGLEVAMACHYRIAVNDSKTLFGLPEVMLGLLPGAGGTQKLPSLINLPEALTMMLTGKSCRADKAKKLGLVDLLVQPLGPGLGPPELRTLEYLEEIAIDIAKQLASKKLQINRKRPLNERAMSLLFSNNYIREHLVFNTAKKKVMKMTNGLYPAPLKILEVVKKSLEHGSAVGYLEEAKAFGELSQTTHSKALIGLFHGQTLCKKNRFGKPTKKIENIGVLGAGLMGAGITAVSIDKGYQVIMKDVNNQSLVRGYDQIDKILENNKKKKKITFVQKDEYLARLLPTLDFKDLHKSDIIIEAVFEDINVKQNIVKEIEKFIRPDCIFASNTSALPISKIAEASKRPENCIGMHYFSPVEKMQLLEVITTDKTSKETSAIAVDVGLKQGKLVIVVKDSPAFYTTRLIAFLMSEAYRLLQEGVEPKKLDALTKAYGWPVGSATLIDEVGMDVGSHIALYLQGVFKERIVGGTLELGKEMISEGFYGRKSGKGWYLYDSKKKGKEREMNPKALQLIKKHSLKPNLSNTDEEIQMRLVTRFVNEAILCIQEGVLENPMEGDIGAVFGLGFPPFLGGPFRFVDTYGADKLVQWMNKFQNAYGIEFEPCQLLLDHAKDSSKKFHPYRN